jgi:hypothetical protein
VPDGNKRLAWQRRSGSPPHGPAVGCGVAALRAPRIRERARRRGVGELGEAAVKAVVGQGRASIRPRAVHSESASVCRHRNGPEGATGVGIRGEGNRPKRTAQSGPQSCSKTARRPNGESAAENVVRGAGGVGVRGRRRRGPWHPVIRGECRGDGRCGVTPGDRQTGLDRRGQRDTPLAMNVVFARGYCQQGRQPISGLIWANGAVVAVVRRRRLAGLTLPVTR